MLRYCELNNDPAGGPPLVRQRLVRVGDLLARAGEPRTALATVASGSFKVSAPTRNGELFIATIAFPGDLLQVHPDPSPWTVSVVALATGIVCELPFAHLEAARRRLPRLNDDLLAAAAAEIERRDWVLRALRSGSVLSRLATLLLECVDKLPSSDGLCQLPISRHDMAIYLGIQRETVSRGLARLRDLGAIGALSLGSFQLRNTTLLRRIADGAQPPCRPHDLRETAPRSRAM